MSKKKEKAVGKSELEAIFEYAKNHDVVIRISRYRQQKGSWKPICAVTNPKIKGSERIIGSRGIFEYTFRKKGMKWSGKKFSKFSVDIRCGGPKNDDGIAITTNMGKMIGGDITTLISDVETRLVDDLKEIVKFSNFYCFFAGVNGKNYKLSIDTIKKEKKGKKKK